MQRGKLKSREFMVGDEVSYALAAGIRYGTVIRVLGDMVEVDFEDGKKEMKKLHDSRLRLLRRQAEQDDRRRYYSDVEEVRRSDIHRGK